MPLSESTTGLTVEPSEEGWRMLRIDEKEVEAESNTADADS